MEINLQFKLDTLGESLDDLAEETIQDLQAMVRGIVDMAHHRIAQRANEKLDKRKLDYLSGLKREEKKENVHIIYLDTAAALSIEEGYGSFDIKKGLLNGNKVKTAANGNKYVDVPMKIFPYANYSSGGETQKIASLAKKLIENKGFGKPLNSKFSKRNTQIFGMAKITGKDLYKSRVSVEYVRYVKKLQGLKKIETQKGKSVSSQYLVFRRVTNKSTGWIHPGHPGVKILDEVAVWIERKIDEHLANITKTKK